MIGTLPTETSTRAYNGNSVASVYISSGYGDLVTKSEAGEGGKSTFEDAALSLQNGIYGMSDPANLQGMVERFEVDLTQGSTNKGVFRIRLINPTDELEVFLFGIYNAVFPGDLTPFDIYTAAAETSKAQTTVNALDTKTPLKELLERGMQLPFLYLRWGYGTDTEQGLSRIHKCNLFGCEYSINANKDKVIELHLTDWFSFLSESQTFNIVPTSTQVDALVSYRLKDFSVLVSDLFLKYTNVFPGVLTVFDEGSSNMKKLDVIVSNYAIRVWNEYKSWEGDADADTFVSQTTLDSVIENYNADGIDLTPEIESAENRLLKSYAMRNKSLWGGLLLLPGELSVATRIWLQAYQAMANYLQLDFRHTSSPPEIVPIGVETPTTSVDSKSTLGKLLKVRNAKRDINIKKFIGVQEFLVPVWEAPFPDPTIRLQVWSPTAQALLALQQQIFTPATRGWINYNPTAQDLGEMKTTLQMPGTGVMGYVTSPTTPYPLAKSFAKPHTSMSPVASENLMSYDELGVVYENMQKLLPMVLNEPIDIASEAFNFLPTVLILKDTILPSLPTFFAGIGAPGVTDPNFLLYSPTRSLTTVEQRVSTNPPYAPLTSAGMLQTRGRSVDDNIFQAGFATTPGGSRAHDEVSIYDSNISKFNTDSLAPMKINHQKIRLCPTIPAITMFMAKFNALTAEMKATASADLTAGMEQTIPGVVLGGMPGMSVLEQLEPKSERLNHSITLSLSQGNSSTPHITNLLRRIVAGINSLAVGEVDPFVIQQVDLETLTPEGLTAVFAGTGLFATLSTELKETTLKNKPTVLLVGRSGWTTNSFAGKLLGQVYSFPEITRTEEDLKDYIFLSYGQKDSIVTDLQFTGDIRTLYNIPRAYYATQQFRSLKNFFKTTKDSETETVLRDLMLFTFELNNRSKVQSLKQRETTVDFSDEKALAVIEKEKDDIKTELLSIEGMTALDYVTFKGYLDEFPSLIPHVTNTDLIQGVRAAGGSSNFDVDAARKIVSVLGTKAFKDLLFPVKKIDKNLGWSEDELKLREVPVNGNDSFYQSRQLNTSFFYNTLEEIKSVAMDEKMNYVKSAQAESWQVEISTLGIPEIDVMGAEFFQRKVVLSVNSPRGGQTTAGADGLHWLTGVYSIVGIKHALEPNSGYITKLSLVKIPGAQLPANVS
tara:strand:- start:22506 stop:26009 length:3504 start_codon:yes stop_codon:yes gene_type:complete